MTVRRLVVGAALAVVVVLVTAGPAAAHATLESTSPADGEHLDKAPTEVTLTFSEDVGAPPRRGPGLQRAGPPRRRRRRRQHTTTRRPSGLNSIGDGGYIVTWRVISADSHPVNGAFTFTVGNGTAASSGLVSSLLNSGSNKKWDIAGNIARGIGYAGTFIAAGGAVFLALVHDGRPDRRRLAKVVLWAAIVGAIGVLVQLPISAALATGLGLGSITHEGVLSQVLADGVGAQTVIGVARACGRDHGRVVEDAHHRDPRRCGGRRVQPPRSGSRSRVTRRSPRLDGSCTPPTSSTCSPPRCGSAASCSCSSSCAGNEPRRATPSMPAAWSRASPAWLASRSSPSASPAAFSPTRRSAPSVRSRRRRTARSCSSSSAIVAVIAARCRVQPLPARACASARGGTRSQRLVASHVDGPHRDGRHGRRDRSDRRSRQPGARTHGGWHRHDLLADQDAHAGQEHGQPRRRPESGRAQRDPHVHPRPDWANSRRSQRRHREDLVPGRETSDPSSARPTRAARGTTSSSATPTCRGRASGGSRSMPSSPSSKPQPPSSTST